MKLIERPHLRFPWHLPSTGFGHRGRFVRRRRHITSSSIRVKFARATTPTEPSLACNDPDYRHVSDVLAVTTGVGVHANRRFADNFSFKTSYVFSSLIGNYEGLFRNDNGQADPNITSLFDLVSLLGNTTDVFRTTVRINSSSTVLTRHRGNWSFRAISTFSRVSRSTRWFRTRFTETTKASAFRAERRSFLTWRVNARRCDKCDRHQPNADDLES